MELTWKRDIAEAGALSSCGRGHLQQCEHWLTHLSCSLPLWNSSLACWPESQPSILDELFLEMIIQGVASHYLINLDSSVLAHYWPEPRDALFATICWICAQHRFGLLGAHLSDVRVAR